MTSPGSTTSVGARLREAREKRGLSLRQVADRTRISVMALEALERNDIKRLPGGIFTRAFLRSYAGEVGLDPDQTVQDFLGQFPHEAPAVGRPTSQIDDNQAIESGRRVAETVMRLLALSIPIAGLVIYLGLRHSTPTPSPQANRVTTVEPVTNAKPPDAIDEPSPAAQSAPPQSTPSQPTPPSRTPPQSTPPLAPAAVSTADALTIVIAPQSDCWVSPTIDGEKLPSQLLAGGQRRELQAAREIVLTVGDGGACAYTLNGVAGRPLGAPGVVVTRRINLENYRSYLMP